MRKIQVGDYVRCVTKDSSGFIDEMKKVFDGNARKVLYAEYEDDNWVALTLEGITNQNGEEIPYIYWRNEFEIVTDYIEIGYLVYFSPNPLVYHALPDLKGILVAYIENSKNPYVVQVEGVNSCWEYAVEAEKAEKIVALLNQKKEIEKELKELTNIF